MKTLLTIIALATALTMTPAQDSCLDEPNLVALDHQYEQALKNNNAAFFESNLSDDFIWVHTHVSAVDTKEDLINRSNDPDLSATGNPVSRTTKDVKVIRLGSTAVVSGFTTVEKEGSSPRYSIMRTWVEVDGHCVLLACQSMRMPDK